MYILSRHALEAVASVWGMHDMDALAAAECGAEDVTVGRALMNRCIYATVMALHGVGDT